MYKEPVSLAPFVETQDGCYTTAATKGIETKQSKGSNTQDVNRCSLTLLLLILLFCPSLRTTR